MDPIIPLGNQPLPERKRVLKKKSGKSFFSLVNSGRDIEEPVHGISFSEPGEIPASVDEVLNEVLTQGSVLIANPTYSNVQKYREKIGRFLAFISRTCYSVEKHELSRFQAIKRRGRPELTVIKIINMKLDRLAADVLMEQRRQIDILEQVHEINGLLVDLMG